MKTYLILGFVVLLFLSGCSSSILDREKYCEVDADCACGTHIKTGDCFYGNKAYVNVLKQCPDFCGGIGGNLAVRCFANKCTQVKVERLEDFCGTSTFGSCTTSADCVVGGCSGQVCQSKNEEPVITTCEFRDCYDADAYKLKCECYNNQCQWKSVF
ncbi:MAG: eight-cysteine-cluster domain-containing protein [Candidatus Nanoarchaeia archaeon]